MVQGAGFVDSHSLFCRFGSVDTAALFLSSTLLSCISPVHAAELTVVEVSNNHADFSTSGVQFEFRDLPIILRLSPSRGPEVGGSVLNVFGSGFYTPSNALWCRFAKDESVAAVFVSSSHLTCVSPPFWGERLAKIRVTANNLDFSETEKIFVYDPVVHIERVAPTSSVYLGGSSVTVTGAFFVSTSDLSCQFADRRSLNVASSDMHALGLSAVSEPWPPSGAAPLQSISRASWHSTSQVVCEVPGLPLGFYEIEISNNGVDFVGNGVLLLIAAEAELDTARPSHGGTAGGTVVEVSGRFFLNSTSLRCRFDASVVLATFRSRNLIACQSPPHNAVEIDLAVSNDGQYFVEGLRFLYVRIPIITQIFPSSGPVLGGTRMNITGSSFDVPFAESAIFCKVGIYLVPADYVSSTFLQCNSPSHIAEVVSVELASNQSDLTANYLSFLYSPAPEVTYLAPSQGPVLGLTEVSIFALHPVILFVWKYYIRLAICHHL